MNFGVVFGVPESGAGLAGIFHFAAGKAAASFVVLAGIGIGLSTISGSVLLKRAVFLFALGLANMVIFPADILHFYAVYFVGAAFVLGASTRLLVATTLAAIVLGALQIVLTNYDANWDWATLEYSGLWTVEGFLRNLFLNGWHPVLPWIGFLLAGMALARVNLLKNAGRIAVGGAGLAVLAAIPGWWGAGLPADTAILFTTRPIPPLPLYMITGLGSACVVIGGSLLAAPRLGVLGRLIAKGGRQSLTLYIAHIFIGMAIIEAAGLIESGRTDLALAWTLVFVGLCLIYTAIWARKFKRGPLEALMRRMAG